MLDSTVALNVHTLPPLHSYENLIFIYPFMLVELTRVYDTSLDENKSFY